MAAVLKKRVIAEFTQVIQEDATPPPAKKLRLHHRGRGKPPTLELHSASSVQEALQRLVKFEENLPIALEFVDQIVQTLLDQYYKAQDASLRAKIASLMGQLSKTPGYTATVLLSDLRSMLNNEKSHKVVCQLLSTLLVMGESAPQDSKLHFQILEMTQKYLKTNAHSVRVKCLELIAALGTPGMRAADAAGTSAATTAALPLEDIMQHYMKDSDPRVRTVAFNALLRWHQRGLRLEQAVYKRLVEALTDDYEGVRLAAMKLIWVVCQLYPEVIIPMADGEENLRMIDDGFGQICHMVNDQCMRVRSEAAGLLGSLHQVSQRFLEQTLDKKLMSDMRRKKSAHERNRENYESGEWSTGKKWADDRPQESLDADAVNVISSGACGALVHGLEDEYLEVRNAAIDSLCELANQSASFANKCQDYLVDMFNDEIEAIRLNAINSIRKISHHVTLREDQLDLVLSVFKDYNPEIRHALREMFSCIHFATKSSLHNCILALLDSLKRYPQDRANVWRCTQHLGRNHAFMTLPLITELLSAHPFFDCPEPDVDDPAYVAVLILVFNAAQSAPTMCQLFPDHISRHYRYLRDTLPDLVPPLTGLTVSSTALSSVEPSQTLVSGFLEQTMQPLSHLDRLPTAHLVQLIPRVTRDLSRISEVDQASAANAECMQLYLECQLCLAKLLSPECAVCVDSPSASGQSPETTSLLSRVFHYCHQMEQLFVGLSLADMASVQQLHLRAHTIRLLQRLQNSGGQDNKHACAQFLMMLNHLQKHLSNNCLTADNFTTSLLAQLHRLEACEPSIFLSVLQMALRLHRPSVLRIHTQLRRATATITQHSATRDNDNRFTAGLATNVQLTAELQNVTEVERIRLQAHYPDQHMQWTLPRTGAWRQTSPLRYELNTEVPLSHGAWSDPCHVELSIVMGYTPDSNLYDDASDVPVSSEATEDTVLELGKPIKVQMLPKPPRR